MDLTITVPVQVSYQKIADTMCSAVEAGSRYWCGGEVTSLQRHDFKFWYADPGFWALSNFSARFTHDGSGSSEGDNNVTTFIGPKDLKEGLILMARDYPHHFADMINDNGDANTGDVLLQCVVLKDVVFG